MREIKIWPHLTIVAVICAILAGGAVALWMRHEQTASAAELPNAARIDRVEGDVALNNSADNSTTTDPDAQWIQATANQPFSVGDRIYTRDNARASLALSGRNFVRLNPNTSIDALSLADSRTQLALRDGAAMFDVGYLAPGELFEVATPYGAVDFQQPGLYNIGINNGGAVVSVLSGLAQVAGLAGSGQISKGEVLTLVGQTAANVVLNQLDRDNAGYLADDYYRYRYPNYYDGRYRNYDTYLADPYYFDPYRRNVSYQYVNQYIPGVNDLDYYGSWQNLDGYGYAWSPQVDNSWSPYQQGYWMNDYPYGPTWVSYEPWGYAPYHYGRWANLSDRWYWIPGQQNLEPSYSPALVAFIPFDQNQIGWVPLGPNDPYLPRYYNSGWQPTYLSRADVIQRSLANLYVPGAVNVVAIDDFGRSGDWKRGWKADRKGLQNINPILDPLTFTPLRNAVIHSAWGRGKIDLPPGIAKKLRDTTVVTSSLPILPPSRRDLTRDLRVETVSERAKGRKFDVRDERGVAQAPRGPGQGNVVERPNQGRGQDQGFNDARNKGQQQKIDQAMEKVQAERAANAARQSAQGERVGNNGRGRGRVDVAPVPDARTNRGAGNSKNVRPVREPGPPVREQQSAPKAAPRGRVDVAPVPNARTNRGAGNSKNARPVRQPGPPVREQQSAPKAAPRGRPAGPPPAAAAPAPQPKHGGGGGQGQRQVQQNSAPKQGGGGNPHAQGGGAGKSGGNPAAQPSGGGKGGGKPKKP